jgi:hypothetical protein
MDLQTARKMLRRQSKRRCTVQLGKQLCETHVAVTVFFVPVTSCDNVSLTAECAYLPKTQVYSGASKKARSEGKNLADSKIIAQDARKEHLGTNRTNSN